MNPFPYRKPLWAAAMVAALAAGWLAGRGRDAATAEPAAAPSSDWFGFVTRLYQRIADHRITAIAGGVTFFVLLAMFPAIAALVSIYGLYGDPASLAAQALLLANVLPDGAIEIIHAQLIRLAAHPNAALNIAFVGGVTLSLWSANAGMKALFDALNIIHDKPETRGFMRLNAITLAFTFGLIAFFLVSISAIVALPVALGNMGGGSADWLVRLGRWPALYIAISLILATIYRFGPSCPHARWRWITWGSATAAFAWIIVSMAFSWYAANFGNFDQTYGTLGAAIGFMTWNWFVTIVILIGAEFDAELDGERPKPLNEAAQ